MRSGHNNKRGRNRHRPSGGGGNNNAGGNPLSRVYESNGPDVKVRGNAQTVADKYLQLGRDAQSAGDIIMAESYYQYAEHYLRIVAAAQAYNQQMQPQYRGPGGDDDFDEEGGDGNEPAQEARQPPQGADQPESGAERPFDGDRQPQQQNYRSQRDNRDQGNQQYGNRDRNQQNQQYGNRDRNNNQPRWQDRRDQQQQPQPQPEFRQAQPQPQPRIEEQPREQAVNGNVAEETPGQWEAPSFLRRPAPLPAPEPVAAEPEAQPQPQPQAVERKPRAPRGSKREKPAEAQAQPAGEVTPQGD